MSSGQATVYVIDDEIQIRTAIGSLCEETGHQVKLFASTDEFLGETISGGPSCLVLDVRFPGTAPTGLELQRRLAETGVLIPIVFISGHSDVRVSVEAMKRGAVEFLPKPFREQEILDAIRHGIERDRRRLEREDSVREARQRVQTLTAREREIMLLMAARVIQIGGTGTVDATIIQNGTRNYVDVIQVGGTTNLAIGQSGVSNIADITQVGNSTNVLLLQIGDMNTGTVRQFGRFNWLSIFQFSR
ncbi:response regulator [Bradyrhizobium sp. 23]|uniref:response regulator n=1 Tax=Bradyrhizobium sp. 23 TaxID=2782667 RepID=UPI001FF91330|nr:response regulator [Bradyrhizobium sp. 23]